MVVPWSRLTHSGDTGMCRVRVAPIVDATRTLTLNLTVSLILTLSLILVLEWQDKENLSGAKEEAEEFLAQQRKLVNPTPQNPQL